MREKAGMTIAATTTRNPPGRRAGAPHREVRTLAALSYRSPKGCAFNPAGLYLPWAPSFNISGHRKLCRTYVFSLPRSLSLRSDLFALLAFGRPGLILIVVCRVRLNKPTGLALEGSSLSTGLSWAVCARKIPTRWTTIPSHRYSPTPRHLL